MTALLAVALPAFGALGALIPQGRPLRNGALVLSLEGVLLVAALLSGVAFGPLGSLAVLGVTLELGKARALVLLGATAATFIGLAGYQGERSAAEVASALGALAGVALLAATGADPVAAALCLFLVVGALSIAVGQVPAAVGTAPANRRLLSWLTLAASALLIAGALDRLYSRQPGPGLLGPVAALFVVGIGVIAAALPFSLWLPALGDGSASAAGLVLGLLSSTAAALVVGTFGVNPWLLNEPAVLSTIALFGTLASAASALLAFGERGVGRSFAYLICANADLALVGLAASPPGDVSGTTWTLATQALAGALGLACLAGASPPRPLVVGDGEGERGSNSVPPMPRGRGYEARHLSEAPLQGLVWRRPALGLAFVVATLSLVGAPVTAGFVGRWEIGHAIAALHPTVLLAFAGASLLGILPAIRFLDVTFAVDTSPAEKPSRLDPAALALAALLIVVGIIPGPILALLR